MYPTTRRDAQPGQRNLPLRWLLTTLLVLFVIRMIKPARDIAFGKKVSAAAAA